jgi:NADH-quinone oxidoreductase subunit N
MTGLGGQIALLVPEIVLASGICALLVLDLFVPASKRDITYLLAIALLVGLALLLLGLPAERQFAFEGTFVSDGLARLLKLFAVLATATVFLYSRPFLEDRRLHHGEYYVLGLFALLGIFVLASAYSLLVLYLGLELLSLSLYAMVAFDRDSPVAAEAAIKYFVLGAIASGTLLYGMSLVYGVTGSLDLAEIQRAAASEQGSYLVFWVGIAFLVAGVAFKFGAVPFHMWVPDVYQGAPTSVTLFVGTAPKLGAIALALRLLVDAFAGQLAVWQPMMATLAILSLTIGNIVAIAQTDLKRLLAYSTIANVGFIFLGFAAGSGQGVQAALFYTLVYVIMAAGSFGFLVLMSRRGEPMESLDDLRGLSQRHPWLALMLLLLMVSQIGIPPLAGFYAKWWVISALVDSGHVGLALAAVVLSVIGAFYYLRIIRMAYFDRSPPGAVDSANREAGPLHVDVCVVLSANALVLLLIGLLPDRLMEMCARAVGLV